MSRACRPWAPTSTSRTATSRRAPSGCKGARLVLDTVTVTGTENLMMAAALADGRDRARERRARARGGRSREFSDRHGRQDQGRGHGQDRDPGRRAAARHALRRAARPHRERHLSGGRRHHRRPHAGEEYAARASGRGDRSSCAEAGATVETRRQLGRSRHARPTAAGGRHPHGPVSGVPHRHAGAVRGAQHRGQRRRHRSSRRSSRIASCTCWRCGAWARRSGSRATRRSSRAWSG